MNLTIKQIEIMKVVVAGAAAGAATDLDQIIERLPYKTTKESLQFSLRALERHELVARSATEYRRGRVRRLIVPTELGHAVIGGTGRPAPGPQSAVAREAISLPQSSGLDDLVANSLQNERIDESGMLAEPEPLSLPELSFPEPQVSLEEILVD